MVHSGAVSITTLPEHAAEPAGEGLREPLPRPLERLLRHAAWEHAVSTRQRVLVPQLHVGVPGEPHPVLAAAEGGSIPDQALGADALHAMRAVAGERSIVWLVRTGPRVAQDVDLAWLAAARQAFAEQAADLVFVVVDRHGWWDPRSGLQATWGRLRRR